MSGIQFLKSIGRMIIFGIYPEYKSATVKVFEQRVNTCYSCEFCQTIKDEFNQDISIKDRCVKGFNLAKNFDIYDHAKYEKSKCPINKW